MQESYRSFANIIYIYICRDIYHDFRYIHLLTRIVYLFMLQKSNKMMRFMQIDLQLTTHEA